MSTFTKVRDAIVNFITTEAKAVLAFLQPTIDALKPQIKQFALEDLSVIVTEASKCIASGKGEACAIDNALKAVQKLAKKQGTELAQTAAVSIAANLVQKAKDNAEGPPVNQ